MWQSVADTMTGLTAVLVALSGLVLAIKKLFSTPAPPKDEPQVQQGQAVAVGGMTETERQYLESLRDRAAEVDDLNARLRVARTRLAQAGLDISDL